MVLAKGFGSFIVRYWYLVLLILIVLLMGSYYSSIRVRKMLLRKRIKKMKLEERILLGLMKKAQTERFKENKISGLVYNIRVKKFGERLNSIKEDLPILEKRLISKKGSFKKKK